MVVLYCGMLIMFFLCGLMYFFCSSMFKKNWMVDSVWAGAYECGYFSSSLSFNYFSFNYFSLLVFFIVFDLEMSLLLNMPEQGELYDKFIYYNMFLLMLAFSFILEVLFGYVRWGY